MELKKAQPQLSGLVSAHRRAASPPFGQREETHTLKNRVPAHNQDGNTTANNAAPLRTELDGPDAHHPAGPLARPCHPITPAQPCCARASGRTPGVFAGCVPAEDLRLPVGAHVVRPVDEHLSAWTVPQLLAGALQCLLSQAGADRIGRPCWCCRLQHRRPSLAMPKSAGRGKRAPVSDSTSASELISRRSAGTGCHLKQHPQKPSRRRSAAAERASAPV